jgi:hypothetical protein
MPTNKKGADMEAITDMLKEFGKFTTEHGIFQTIILIIIVAYVLRDWFIRKQSTSLFDALVDNSKITTRLFERQVDISERASIAAAMSATELSKQTGKLDTLCKTQDQMIDLTKSGNLAITKLADSFGSDPFKICQQKPCHADDETIVERFAKAWNMPHDKVRERLKMVKEIRDDAAEKVHAMGAT